MNILFFVADGFTEYNSSNWRVSIPYSALVAEPSVKPAILHIRHWLEQTREAKIACALADIIVIQRVMVAESIQHTIYWTQKGKRVIVDFDDAYDLIRPDNAAYEFWGAGRVKIKFNATGKEITKQLDQHPIEQFKEGLQMCTAATMPSKVLASDWSREARTFYLPNYIDSRRYQNVIRAKDHEDRIVIGWGGSLSHVPSFTDSGVIEALTRVVNDRDNVYVLICGDKRILKYFNLPEGRLLFKPYVKWSDWPQMLTHYDIGIAPLAGRYDQRRSWIKVLEYLTMGIPFAATKSAVYEAFMDKAVGCYVDQGPMTVCDDPNPDGWYQCLIDLVDKFDDHYAKSEGHRDTRKYDVFENVGNIVKVYQEIMKLD